MRQNATLLLVATLGATLAGCATTGVTNVGGAQGYSIAFVNATPSPGTPIQPGAVVAFGITVRYDLRLTDKARIVLVFENEKNELLFPGEKQVSLEVVRGSREVTLSHDITVPEGLRELRLFVPLAPEGLSRTSGELLIKYPVRKKP